MYIIILTESFEYLFVEIQIHKDDEPYLNKPIEDYDLFETVCGNDQATGHRAVTSGSRIGTQMDYNSEPDVFPPNQSYDDVPFMEADEHGNDSPFTQPDNSEPTSTTSPMQRRKEKGKRKATVNDDAILRLATSIENAFDKVQSSRSVSFAKDVEDECMKLTQYGYSIDQILMVYEHLMSDEARARMFFGMRQELRMAWANKFFNSGDWMF